MRFSPFLVGAAAVYSLIGCALAVWPIETLGFAGVTLELPARDQRGGPTEPVWSVLVLLRMYGALLIGLGAFVFVLRRISSRETQRLAVSGLFALNVLAGVLTLRELGGSSAPVGIVGYGPIAMLALGFGALAVAFGRQASRVRAIEPAAAETGDLTTGDLREAWLGEVREAAAQEERSRLARELHDSVKQQLFTINVSAAAAQARFDSDPAGARAALADSRRAAHEAMTEMQAMLQHLQPAPLAAVGLVEALRQQCEATRFRTGAAVTLDVGGLIDEAVLPPGTHSSLFRIAQEALSNVARHSRARHVRVCLGRSVDAGPWALELGVEDDGTGFDGTSSPRGMGLSNIHDRARAIQAHVVVESATGSGTRVTVRVPLASEARHPAARQLARAALLGPVVALVVLLPGLPPVLGDHPGHLLALVLLLFAVACHDRDLKAPRATIAQLERAGGAGAREALRLRRDARIAEALTWGAATAMNPWYSLLLDPGRLGHPGAAWIWGIILLGIFAFGTVRTVQALAGLRDLLCQQRAHLPTVGFHRELQELWQRSLAPVMLFAAAFTAGALLLRLPLFLLMPVGSALWLAGLWRMMRREASAIERTSEPAGP